MTSQIEEAWLASNEMRSLGIVNRQLQQSAVFMTTGVATDQDELRQKSLTLLRTSLETLEDSRYFRSTPPASLLSRLEDLTESVRSLNLRISKEVPSQKELLEIIAKTESLSEALSLEEGKRWSKNLEGFKSITERFKLFNKIMGVLGVLLVIGMGYLLNLLSKKLKMENLLRKKEKLRSFLFSSLSEAIFLCSSDGLIKSCNNSSAKLFNKTTAKLIGVSIDLVFKQIKIFTPENNLKEESKKLSQLVSKGVSLNGLKLLVEGKENRWFNLNLQPIAKDKEGKDFSVLISLNEITEMMRKESQLKEQEVRLIESIKSETIAQLAGGIAHEINNPLSIISVTAQVLEHKSKDKELVDAALVAKSTERVISTTQRISSIVKGLLALSRKEDNEFREESLSNIFMMTTEFCQLFFGSGAVKLIQENLETQTVIECNPIQVSQALVNLLKNSSEAVRDLDERWVKLSCEEGEDEVIIRVTDSGTGLSDEMKENILKPFYTTKGVGKGTGFGLSISRTIIENHHGSLVVDKDSENTQFTLRLPKKQPEKVEFDFKVG